MADINTEFICLIAEMRRLGNTPAPSKGGSFNNLLRYRETREKILDRFLDAFVAGYRLQMTGNAPTLTPPNEPLTCRGCMYLPDCPSGIHCYGCARLYTDNYRRPPEGEADD